MDLQLLTELSPQVGIQWLLDQGEGAKPGGSFLWELLRLLRSKADSLMVAARARSHCRFVLPLVHFIPASLTNLVPLCLER